METSRSELLERSRFTRAGVAGLLRSALLPARSAVVVVGLDVAFATVLHDAVTIFVASVAQADHAGACAAFDGGLRNVTEVVTVNGTISAVVKVFGYLNLATVGRELVAIVPIVVTLRDFAAAEGVTGMPSRSIETTRLASRPAAAKLRRVQAPALTAAQLADARITLRNDALAVATAHLARILRRFARIATVYGAAKVGILERDTLLAAELLPLRTPRRQIVQIASDGTRGDQERDHGERSGAPKKRPAARVETS
jgi:hypothetical protein